MQESRTEAAPNSQATFLLAAAEIRAVIEPQGLVLLHMSKGMFYRANHVGARVWEKLAAGMCLDGIVHQIANEFGVPTTAVAPDVCQFVGALLDQGFLMQENR
jgi:hypothetical protein